MDPISGLILLIIGVVSAVSGVGFGIADTVNKQRRERDEAYYNALSSYNQIESSINQTETSILQTEANISSFDEALLRWQGEFDTSLESFEQQGQAQYDQLYQNWQGTELAMAATGRVGGSAALVSAQREAQLEAFAGADLRFDAEGGTWASTLQSFYADSFAGLNSLQINRANAVTSLGIYRDSLAQYELQLEEQRKILAEYDASFDVGGTA